MAILKYVYLTKTNINSSGNSFFFPICNGDFKTGSPQLGQFFFELGFIVSMTENV